MAIGEKVRELRSTRELPLRELRRQTGISSGYLTQVEKGDIIPGEDKLVALADAFGGDAEALKHERNLTLTEKKVAEIVELFAGPEASPEEKAELMRLVTDWIDERFDPRGGDGSGLGRESERTRELGPEHSR